LREVCFAQDFFFPPQCWSGKLTSIALSAFVDVYLAVYPAVVLFKLQLKLRKKLALVVALSIGCV
jgi:hypothetical protein